MNIIFSVFKKVRESLMMAKFVQQFAIKNVGMKHCFALVQRTTPDVKKLTIVLLKIKIMKAICAMECAS